MDFKQLNDLVLVGVIDRARWQRLFGLPCGGMLLFEEGSSGRNSIFAQALKLFVINNFTHCDTISGAARDSWLPHSIFSSGLSHPQGLLDHNGEGSLFVIEGRRHPWLELRLRLGVGQIILAARGAPTLFLIL